MNLFRPLLSNILGYKNCSCLLTKKRITLVRCISQENPIQNSPKQEKNLKTKYQIFNEDDSELILDISDEARSNQYGYDLPKTNDIDSNFYEGLNLNRGITGVFDIEDLVDVLKREHGQEIFVVKIPEDVKYADYICFVSGKSLRHMQAIAQFVRRVYKMKRWKGDVVPKLEGANSKDWLALDLGNIVLHIFSTEARKHYDLDSLWAVGHRLDPEFNKKDPLVEMLEKNTYYLKDLKPAS